MPKTSDPVVPKNIWMRPEQSQHGPVPAYSRRQIANVAIAIADAEGLEAVSMRRIAKDLGAAAPSLYRYFLSRQELYEVMADTAVGELELPQHTGDWAGDLRAVAERERQQLRSHPWLLTIPGVRPMFGPNSLSALDHALAAVEPLNIDIDQMMVTVSAVLALVHGFVMTEIVDSASLAAAGTDTSTRMAEFTPYIASVVDSGEYPRFARVILDATGPHRADYDDWAFHSALDRLLDGIAAGF